MARRVGAALARRLSISACLSASSAIRDPPSTCEALRTGADGRCRRRLRRPPERPIYEVPASPAMAINAVRNRRSGPGGGARRLHQSLTPVGVAYGGDLGSTRVVKGQFLPGMVPPLPGQITSANDNVALRAGCLNSSSLAARGGAGQQKPPHFTRSECRASMRRSRIDYGRLVESALADGGPRRAAAPGLAKARRRRTISTSPSAPGIRASPSPSSCATAIRST